MARFTFIDLLAGIGGTRLAFERARGRCLFASEIDEDARRVYLDNFGEEPFGDIREIDERDVPDHDILTACIPSPSLSIAGRKHPRSKDNLSLFGDVIRIVDAKKPAAFFLQGMVGLLRPLRIHQNIMDVLNDKLSYYSLHKHIIDARCVVP